MLPQRKCGSLIHTMAPTLSPSQLDEATRTRLTEIWQRLLPQTLERLELLDRAARAAAAGDLTPALHSEAVSSAHKFAGSLGTFGFEQGTRLARELQAALSAEEPDACALTDLIARLREAIFPNL